MLSIVQKDDGGAVLKNELSGTEVFRAGGPASASVANPIWLNRKTAKVPLSAAADTAGAILAWANPEGTTILITDLVIYTTTKSSAASTADFGIAANGTTLSDTLIDGVDLGTATGVFDNIKNGGTNGKASQTMGATQYLTGSTASGAIAGAVGFAYITYLLP